VKKIVFLRFFLVFSVFLGFVGVLRPLVNIGPRTVRFVCSDGSGVEFGSI